MTSTPNLKQAYDVCAGNESSTGGFAGHDPVWNLAAPEIYVMQELQGTEHFVGICRHCSSVVVFPNRVRKR